jgi:hypothetical protein
MALTLSFLFVLLAPRKLSPSFSAPCGRAVTLSATLCFFYTPYVESFCLFFACLSFSLQRSCLSLISLSCLFVLVSGIGDGSLSLVCPARSKETYSPCRAASDKTLGRSLGEYDCWASCLADNLLGERVAR